MEDVERWATGLTGSEHFRLLLKPGEYLIADVGGEFLGQLLAAVFVADGEILCVTIACQRRQ